MTILINQRGHGRLTNTESRSRDKRAFKALLHDEKSLLEAPIDTDLLDEKPRQRAPLVAFREGPLGVPMMAI